MFCKKERTKERIKKKERDIKNEFKERNKERKTYLDWSAYPDFQFFQSCLRPDRGVPGSSNYPDPQFS